MPSSVSLTRPHASDDTDARSASRSDDGRPRRNGRAAGRGQDGDGQHSAAEWLTLAMSSLIVLGLIALTTYFYLTGSTAPAIVEVEPRIAETYQAGGRFYLPVTVHNSGGSTGEEVRIRVTATGPAGPQETAEFQVQFLAGGGSSKAVVSFASDPRQSQVSGAAISYLEP